MHADKEQTYKNVLSTDVLQVQDVGVKMEPSQWPWPAGWYERAEILHAGSNGLN